MKRAIAISALVLFACDDSIPGLCKVDSDCSPTSTGRANICYEGICVIGDVADGDAGLDGGLDGGEGADAGPFCTPSSSQERNCGDGNDDDCDGLIDCADSDCDEAERCLAGACSLSTTKAGSGDGVVASSPIGIDCGATCATKFYCGSLVALTATPATGSTFSGWRGDCTGSADCTVAMDQARSVVASFDLIPVALTVMKTGPGSGTVKSDLAGVDCGASCATELPYGSRVTLTATPATGFRFTGWTGGECTGTSICVVTLTAPLTIQADFSDQFPLTVTAGYGDGLGRVSSSPAGITCGAECRASYPYGTKVQLTATPATTPASAESIFTGWTGACSGLGACAVTMTDVLEVSATFSLKPNIAFVTSTTYSGNLGGLTGADAACRGRAQAAGLPGTYQAWLSTSTGSALGRFQGVSGWVRTDGKPFADSAGDLASGRIRYPLRISELGGDLLHSVVATATGPTGTYLNNGSCLDFTSASSALETAAGTSAGVGWLFTAGLGINCAGPFHLYCLGVDRAARVSVAPASPRRLTFMTNVGWAPGGGLTSADAQCQREASNAGLSGTYLAMLATTTASAASRFDTRGAPWARIDGAAVTPSAANMFTTNAWDVAMNWGVDGTTYGNDGVWGGAPSLVSAGTAATTCNDWTSSDAASTGSGGRPGFTIPTDFFAFDKAQPCNQTLRRLACLQK